ncbi:hypothetical protein [Methanosphaerula palustris]|uniref:Uncharacterized protein n=1 Tax=Methanosphaerula palustris (strain ATCC BAA-1556 / DSM 19958 / E1-9c) TaxID=521011 RepID=B8GFM0_METPE|nr:hypothetical protein [Methanosphaerula palustris]ACL16068.1 hypothetical protein Mpal_0701 [Methanosphaerula palustris E1-9c]
MSLPGEIMLPPEPFTGGDAVFFVITWQNTFECSALFDIKEEIVPVTAVFKYDREEQVEVPGERKVMFSVPDRPRSVKGF